MRYVVLFFEGGQGDVLRLRDYDVKSLAVFGLYVEKEISLQRIK